MQGVMVRPLSVPWWWLPAAVVWSAVNAAVVFFLVIEPSNWKGDWLGIEVAVNDLLAGRHPYGGFYAYPPLMTGLLAHAIIPAGFATAVIAHFIALIPLWRDRLLLVIVFTSAAFWVDVLVGNFLTFIAVAGLFAVRGNRPAGLAYLAMAMLVPRPMYLPLAVWLLWRKPSLRIPALLMAVGSVAFTLASGQTEAWLTAAVRLSSEFPWREWDLGPTRFLGPLWLVAGIPLAAWLASRGWVGIAGLAIAPYIAPFYLLLILVDWPRIRSTLRRP